MGAALRAELGPDEARLVVLHGSRARDTAEPDSDRDVAVRGGPAADPGDLTARLVRLTGTDAVDVDADDLDRPA